MSLGCANIRYSAALRERSCLKTGGKLSVNYSEPTTMEYLDPALFGQSQQAVSTTGRSRHYRGNPIKQVKMVEEK